MPARNSWLPKPTPIEAGGVTLPAAVVKQFGAECPCCGRGMTHDKPQRYKPQPRNKATVGHDVAVARGGHDGAWYWQCYACNNDQGALDLVTWGRKLVYGGDRRAGRVVAVASFVRRFVARWLAEKEEVA